MTTTGVVDIGEIANATARPWELRDVVRANDTVIRLAKLDGEFAWHEHDEDKRPETLQYGNPSR